MPWLARQRRTKENRQGQQLLLEVLTECSDLNGRSRIIVIFAPREESDAFSAEDSNPTEALAEVGFEFEAEKELSSVVQI